MLFYVKITKKNYISDQLYIIYNYYKSDRNKYHRSKKAIIVKQINLFNFVWNLLHILQ